MNYGGKSTVGDIVTLQDTQKNIFLRALDVWIVFLVATFASESLQSYLLFPLIGDYASHIIGTVALTVFVAIIIYFFVKKYHSENPPKVFLRIGILWAASTVLFEIVFGHYISGAPWRMLVSDYDIFKGRILSVVIAVELFLPIVIRHFFSPQDASERTSA